MSDLFQPNKNPAAASRWASVLAGYLTATGAPSKARLAGWPGFGVTDVVTLQRQDEMAKWLPHSCKQLGLSWHHYPLSGRRLSDPADSETLRRLGDLVTLLEQAPSRRIVVHCAAGMHRTGLVSYLVLRHAGMTSDRALQAVQHIRPLTAAELTKATHAAVPLMEQAEEILRVDRGASVP